MTEFCLQQERLSFRQGTVGHQAIGAFRLAALGTAWLHDPDTESFDGGYMTVELVAGSGKGDTIGFLTPDQQERQYLLEQPQSDWDEVPKTIVAKRPILELIEEDGIKKIRHQEKGTIIGTMIFIKSKNNGCQDMRINFAKSETEGEYLVPLWFAAYMLNCLTYTNIDSEKTREGMRAYRLSICDPENSTPGKIVIHIDVMGPILYSPGFVSDVLTFPGNEVSVGSKVSILISEKTPITKGYLEAILLDPTETDSLVLSLSKLGLAIREGILFEGSKYIGKITVTQTSMRLDFTWASKATRQPVQNLVRAVGFCTETESMPQENRRIIFACSDKQSEPNIVTVTVKVREKLKPKK